MRGQALRSTVLSFVDTAGEDLNDLGTAFTLKYLSVCDALMITLDPFALPGARARLRLPSEAVQVGDDVPLDVVSRITELLRTEHQVKNKRKIKLPIALVFTKIDAFYAGLDRHNPIMAQPPRLPAYQDADGRTVHEHMLALMRDWNATDIDTHMRLNYSDYRYFGVSALGAEPDYREYAVAPGGVQPHRVEDPVLWLLSKTRTVPVDMTAARSTACSIPTAGPGPAAAPAAASRCRLSPPGWTRRRRRWLSAGCCTTRRTPGSSSGARSRSSRSAWPTPPRPDTGPRRAGTWAPRRLAAARAITSPTACSPATAISTVRPGPPSSGGRRSGVRSRGRPRTARSSTTRWSPDR